MSLFLHASSSVSSSFSFPSSSSTNQSPGARRVPASLPVRQSQGELFTPQEEGGGAPAGPQKGPEAAGCDGERAGGGAAGAGPAGESLEEVREGGAGEGCVRGKGHRAGRRPGETQRLGSASRNHEQNSRKTVFPSLREASSQTRR